MKTIITLLIVLIAINISALNDKEKHFVAGATIAVATQEITYAITKEESASFIFGQVAAITAGMGKELLDVSKGKNFSGADFNCTALGAFCSVLPNLIINRVLFPEYYNYERRERHLERIRSRYNN